MGITKQYLRWIPSSMFGVIGSPIGNVIFINQNENINRQLVAVAACEKVFIWNVKTGELVQILSDGNSQITSLCAHNDNQIIVSGHQDGTIRIFDYKSGSLKVTFSGHKSAVNCVALSSDGMRLASGGKDTEIVIWDIVNESGLFRLKGHKNGITKLQFMSSHDNIVISSSRDTFIKFWDLNTQHCFKTVTGHRSEVWSFSIFNDDNRLISGAGDSELKVWDITFKDDDPDKFNEKIIQLKNSKKDYDDDDDDDDETADDENDILVVTHAGTIMRKSTVKLANIFIDPQQRMLVCHGVENFVECFRIKTEDEVKASLVKRAKKEKKKRKRENPEDDVEIHITKTLSDEIERLEPFKTSSKVKSCDLKFFHNECRVVTLLANNSFEIYSIKPNSEIQTVNSIRINGHRSDVRTVAFSSDNFLALSASAESVKIWNTNSQKSIATIDQQVDYALCSLFVPGDRYCITGTKNGKLQIFEINIAQLQQTIDASEDGQPIWSICLNPNQREIVSGSEDKLVKFWAFEYAINKETKTKYLTLVCQRTLKMDEGILCVKITPNSKLLAVSLLDSTVKIFFMDSLKFFLNLYGHKFPVLCMDISYDSTLIATGSSDKNVKIWGLDFGDCHKSIFAHDDNVTCLQFIPKTHYFFTSSKDKLIKQWDADHFQKITTLTGHQAEIWALSVSSNGKLLFTASHDKSLRFWEKTDEPLILEEEQEQEREKEFESSAFSNEETVIPGETNKETALASKKTIETVKGTERLIEALDVFKEEMSILNQFANQCRLAEQKGVELPKRPAPNPLIRIYQTDCPYRFMLEAIRHIKTNELEETLLTLPFNYITELLTSLTHLLQRNWEVELLCRCACFILR